jgi:ribonuclease BN (tRNA processing enzyme)
MSMRLFVGGMRGSQPSVGSAFEEFGGDTTSLLLVGSRGERLVLDAGTGMHVIAQELATTGPGVVTILFSHYHLDHMAGLTMNPLFYRSDWSFRFMGPTFANGGVREAVTRLLAPPYWPISWEKMGARFDFVEFAIDGIQTDGLRVRACQAPHPGGSLSYRVEDTHGGASLVFATDLEWRSRTDAFETSFKTLCREPKPTDLLIIDAHFDRAHQEAFAGWGHTSWEDDLDIAESAGIRRVLLGHHAPEANDETLKDLETHAKKCLPGAALARAGQWITIGGTERSC